MRQTQAGALPASAAWVTLQDALRTPTQAVIFPLSYARTVPVIRDPVSKAERPGPGRVLQGHPGAVNAPLDESGYRSEVIQQTEGSPGWHKALENIFTTRPGVDMATMRAIVDDIDGFWRSNLWFGDEASLGFDEYYARTRGPADGTDLIAFGVLRERASKASTDIENNFAAARHAVGL